MSSASHASREFVRVQTETVSAVCASFAAKADSRVANPNKHPAVASAANIQGK
jgi:hypothetical protein